MDERTRELAQLVWDYLRVDDEPVRSDVILVLGSNDLRVADRGAELFLGGLAPWILFSGGIAHTGDLLATGWSQPEARVFSERCQKLGVPRERMILEERATNTGENFEFARAVLRARGVHPKSAIVVQKPFMGRRAFATAKKVWPGLDVRVTSPQIPFDDYPTRALSQEKMINTMVGDLQRVREYGQRGYQIPQEIPPEVSTAFDALVALGYNEHLIGEAQ